MDKVVHFEIPADDIDRAQKFYKEIFGWKITDASMPGAKYYIAQTVETDSQNMPKEPGAINGGLMEKSNSGKTPVIVINVSSVDNYLKKIEESGGKVVMPKQQVADMGLYARVIDTEGNVIGIWQDLKRN